MAAFLSLFFSLTAELSLLHEACQGMEKKRLGENTDKETKLGSLGKIGHQCQEVWGNLASNSEHSSETRWMLNSTIWLKWSSSQKQYVLQSTHAVKTAIPLSRFKPETEMGRMSFYFQISLSLGTLTADWVYQPCIYHINYKYVDCRPAFTYIISVKLQNNPVKQQSYFNLHFNRGNNQGS